jgi:hypothetical protein
MIDRVDLLIAVLAVVVSLVGSQTAMWVALSKKADRSDLIRVEARLEGKLGVLEAKLDALDDRIGGRLTGIETILARIDERLAAVERNA